MIVYCGAAYIAGAVHTEPSMSRLGKFQHCGTVYMSSAVLAAPSMNELRNSD